MLRTTLALLLVAGIASAEDSPLVAAAKRSNRQASKTPVITNSTLAKSRGRLSTASEQLPPLPSPTVAPGTKPAAPAPARDETRTTQTQQPATPASTARMIEPSSSARSTAPTSSARSVEPTSGVRNTDPSSTARTVQPQSTAKTVNPQAAKPVPVQ